MQTRIVNKKIFLIFALSVFAIGSITPDSFAYADDEQNALDVITDIEFRTVTDFHTFVPDSQLRFDVSCNELAGEFAIGFNTFLQKADGTPADVNGLNAFGLAGLSFGPFGVFVKAGVIDWDANADSGTDSAYGVGARFQFGSLAVRVEYEEFDVSGLDTLDLTSASLVYTF